MWRKAPTNQSILSAVVTYWILLLMFSIGCLLQDDYINMTAKLIQHIQGQSSVFNFSLYVMTWGYCYCVLQELHGYRGGGNLLWTRGSYWGKFCGAWGFSYVMYLKRSGPEVNIVISRVIQAEEFIQMLLFIMKSRKQILRT